jgi:AGCS family alanine or glycine:cation symporter
MYRGKDSQGKVQGGTMYMIREGLGGYWKPLAFIFSLAGIFGALPIFQANQLTQILRDVIYVPNGWVTDQAHFWGDLITGLGIFGIVSIVIFGGIKRIGKVASRMVPFMVVLYMLCVFIILGLHYDVIPYYLKLIVTDAFSAKAAMGGALGALIITGFKRAAFSNEAGIGTATMAHGAAKTKEPVREGLVAMLGPAIDTLLVCTLTAMAILVTGVWKTGSENGIALTASAFESLGIFGPTLLVICVAVFSFSTLFTYSYYGSKCMGYLFGAEYQSWYNYLYVLSIVLGAVGSIKAVISLIDGMFAVMAFPTMIAAIVLAPKVKEAAMDYFSRIDSFEEYETKMFR